MTTPAKLCYNKTVILERDQIMLWNLAPVIIRKNLFAPALEASPAIEGLIEKYAKLEFEWGRNPD